MVNDVPDTLDTHFQGRDEREQFQFYFHQHWIRLVKPFCTMLLWTTVVVVAGYFIFSSPEITSDMNRHGILVALFCMFAVLQLHFLARFYTYFLYVIIVTDRRVHRIKKTLLLTDDHQTIDIWTFQDIHKSQHGPIQNLLGFGTLILEANETMLRLHFVPHIAHIYGQISRVREAARERTAAQRQAENMNGNPSAPSRPS